MNDRDQRESRRILTRVGQETEASMARRATRRMREHMSGSDAEQDDWAEVWGTRIGRALGLALLLVLVWWLVSFVLGG